MRRHTRPLLPLLTLRHAPARSRARCGWTSPPAPIASAVAGAPAPPPRPRHRGGARAPLALRAAAPGSPTPRSTRSRARSSRRRAAITSTRSSCSRSMHVESRYDTFAVSDKDAMGLMQILPSTGEWLAPQVGVRLARPADALRPDRERAARRRLPAPCCSTATTATSPPRWSPTTGAPGHIDGRLREGAPLPVAYARPGAARVRAPRSAPDQRSQSLDQRRDEAVDRAHRAVRAAAEAVHEDREDERARRAALRVARERGHAREQPGLRAQPHARRLGALLQRAVGRRRSAAPPRTPDRTRRTRAPRAAPRPAGAASRGSRARARSRRPALQPSSGSPAASSSARSAAMPFVQLPAPPERRAPSAFTSASPIWLLLYLRKRRSTSESGAPSKASSGTASAGTLAGRTSPVDRDADRLELRDQQCARVARGIEHAAVHDLRARRPSRPPR